MTGSGATVSANLSVELIPVVTTQTRTRGHSVKSSEEKKDPTGQYAVAAMAIGLLPVRFSMHWLVRVHEIHGMRAKK